MQIDQIETFVNLVETRSFNQTAERLGVTQSTVSGRIAALEKALGWKLFVRGRAGTALTTEGLKFAPHARGLLHGWTEARHAMADAGTATTFRIGIQADLVAVHFAELIASFRAALPDTAFFFEADYSVQMCNDLIAGVEDLIILFSPRYHVDLVFETLGEVTYLMVSTETDALEAVRPESYILPHYSYSMPQIHAALLPQLAKANLSIGQNAAMVALLRSLGGSAYVLRDSAHALEEEGICRMVAGAPPIVQPVHGGVHVRNRHRSAHRRLFQILRSRFGTGIQPSARRRAG